MCRPFRAPWLCIPTQGALKGRHITAFHHKISHINKNKSRNHGPISPRFRLEILCTAQAHQAKGGRNPSWRPDTEFPFVFAHEKIAGICYVQNRRIFTAALPRLLLMPETTHDRKCRRIIRIVFADVDIGTSLQLVFLQFAPRCVSGGAGQTPATGGIIHLVKITDLFHIGIWF